METVDMGISLDYLKLVETRMLINAGSGGGKSWLIRRLLEVISRQNLQQIVFDYEGEFVTLREKFPFALVAVNGGDIPLSVAHAGKLAEMIMKTNVSVIIDLYDLEPDDRVQFVHEFVHALMKLPKELYHPTLIYIDEIDVFCPQVGMTAASKDIRNLAARGRKRGLGTVFATQRLSKVHKDLAAECQNKLFGLTTLGIDIARAADELGMSSREQGIFRELEPGNFLALGPAFPSRKVEQFMVSAVETTHVKAGTMVSAPPTPDAILSILAQLKDMPTEEDQEDKGDDGPISRRNTAEVSEYLRQIGILRNENTVLQNRVVDLSALLGQIHHLTKAWDRPDKSYEANEPEVRVMTVRPAGDLPAHTNTLQGEPEDVVPSRPKDLRGSAALGKCPRAIITFLASMPGRQFSKAQVAIATSYSVSSGGFKNALAELNSKGMITRAGDVLEVNTVAMPDIIDAVGPITRRRYDISTFRSQLGKCEAEIFDVLLKHPRHLYEKEGLAAATQSQYSPTSGGYKNALARLNTLEIIVREKGGVRLNPELLEFI